MADKTQAMEQAIKDLTKENNKLKTLLEKERQIAGKQQQELRRHYIVFRSINAFCESHTHKL